MKTDVEQLKDRQQEEQKRNEEQAPWYEVVITRREPTNEEKYPQTTSL